MSLHLRRLLLPTTIVSVICGSACSDYDLTHGGDDDQPPGDDDTTTAPDDDTTAPPDDDTTAWPCSDRDYPAGTVDVVSICSQPTGLVVVPEWFDPPWSSQPGAQYSESTPIVAQLNDDNGDGDIDAADVPDIVMNYFESMSYEEQSALRAMSGDGSGELWSVVGSACTPFDELAAGDIDGDGHTEIICTGLYSVRSVSAYRDDGTLWWTSEMLPMLASKYFVVSQGICDLDGDGQAEILAGRYVLDNDGTVRLTLNSPPQEGYNYFAASTCADIDADGTPEILAAGAVYDNTGTLLWDHSQFESHQAVGQFDSDDEAEILFTTSNEVTVYEHDGTVLWTAPLGAGGSYDASPPTLADSDGDGLSEVFVPKGGQIKALDHDGAALWSVPGAGTGQNALSAHDLNSDGVLDLVVQSAGQTQIVSALDGSVEWSSVSGTEKSQAEYCVIADVDNDLSAEIVCPHSTLSTNPGLVVLGSGKGTWQPTDGQWNQYAYRYTDLDGGVSVPEVEDPPWLAYQGWRQARPSGVGGVGDLIPEILEVCQSECDEGHVWVWFRAANQGAGTADGPLQVSLYANRDGTLTWVKTVEIPDAPDEGVSTQGIAVDLPASAFGDGATLVLIVDSDAGGQGDFIECDETNNTALYTEPICTAYEESARPDQTL